MRPRPLPYWWNRVPSSKRSPSGARTTSWLQRARRSKPPRCGRPPADQHALVKAGRLFRGFPTRPPAARDIRATLTLLPLRRCARMGPNDNPCRAAPVSGPSAAGLCQPLLPGPHPSLANGGERRASRRSRRRVRGHAASPTQLSFERERGTTTRTRTERNRVIEWPTLFPGPACTM